MEVSRSLRLRLLPPCAGLAPAGVCAGGVCHLPAEALRALGVRLGAPVLVVRRGRAFLCAAHPAGPDLPANTCRADLSTRAPPDATAASSPPPPPPPLPREHTGGPPLDRADNPPELRDDSADASCGESWVEVRRFFFVVSHGSPSSSSETETAGACLSPPRAAARVVVHIPGARARLSSRALRRVRALLLRRLLCPGCVLRAPGIGDGAGGRVADVVKVASVQPAGGCVRFGWDTAVVAEPVPPAMTMMTMPRRARFGGLCVGGLDAQVDELLGLLRLPLRHGDALRVLGVSRPPRGVLLKGPAGCGKTLAVRAAVAEAGAVLVTLDQMQRRTGPWAGETERLLRDAFERAARDGRPDVPSVVLLEDLDVLCAVQDKPGGRCARASSQLAWLLDGLVACRKPELVVACTRRPDLVAPALRRPGRLDCEIEVPVPDVVARAEIFRALSTPPHFDASRVAFSDDDLRRLAQELPGFVGSDLVALWREAVAAADVAAASAAAAGGDSGSAGRAGAVGLAELRAAARTVQPSAAKGESFFESSRSDGWVQVGGYAGVIARIRRAVEWPLHRADELRRFDLAPVRGILLHGPPGTGKTSIARALAAEVASNFFATDAASVFSEYLGDAEGFLRELFRKARAASPSVVFIDELDALVGRRADRDASASGSDDVRDRVLATLLTELDGIESAAGVVFIGATNRVDLIDEALLRPGRVDLALFVGPPDTADREAIWRVHLQPVPLAAGVSFENLAQRSEGCTGADIEHLCREAALAALRDGRDAVAPEDLERVLPPAAASSRPAPDADPFTDPTETNIKPFLCLPVVQEAPEAQEH